MVHEINTYGRQLTGEEIAAGVHREVVGGLWDQLGPLQFDFMVQHGLQRSDHLLDVGCGALRGGVHFVRYLDPGHYCGLDINASLIEAGRQEIEAAGLKRDARLLVDDAFRFERFGQSFDRAIAVSVFTHLPMNHVVRCLVEMEKVLAPQGRFYATVFLSPGPAHLSPIAHDPGGIITHYDQDPFHCSLDEMRFLAGIAGMRVGFVGEWDHPRAQQMLCFSRA